MTDRLSDVGVWDLLNEVLTTLRDKHGESEIGENSISMTRTFAIAAQLALLRSIDGEDPYTPPKQELFNLTIRLPRDVRDALQAFVDGENVVGGELVAATMGLRYFLEVTGYLDAP